MSTNKFILDGRYGDLLQYFGMNVEEALRKAELPEDTFAHKTPILTEEEYYRFMQAVGDLMEDPAMALKVASTNRIENFSPPIFASYCAKNGRMCIERLARYKKLIAPMQFIISEDEKTLSVKLKPSKEDLKLPFFLVESEFVFLVHIIQMATKEDIVPVSVTFSKELNSSELNHFFGDHVSQGENMITFNKDDLMKPFISYNEAMWEYFQPEMNKRLSELEVDDSTSARVRSALSELLPGGLCGIEDVAEKLGLSKRTLQRKLKEENTTFQKQLNSTRETLAIHYIRNTDMTTNDIAYLLGYAERNSFLRAFTIWTGKTITEYRRSMA